MADRKTHQKQEPPRFKRLDCMRLAIALGSSDHNNGGNGIGAVIARRGQLIAQATSTLRGKCDPTLHAEMNAIRAACRKLGSKYLEGCVLYSTFEPCPMCTSAAIWAKMRGIVFGALISDRTAHAHQRILITASEIAKRGKPKLKVRGGLLRNECLPLLN